MGANVQVKWHIRNDIEHINDVIIILRNHDVIMMIASGLIEAIVKGEMLWESVA